MLFYNSDEPSVIKKISVPKDIIIITSLIVAYGILFSFYVLMRHHYFMTASFDLGIFNQAFWKFIHHGHMITSIERIPPVDHFAIHFSPALYFLVPFYWIYSKPQTLLVLQSFIIGLGALPIYLIAKHKTNNVVLSLVIACSYFIYPGIFHLNRYDFHEMALTVPLLLFSLYYLEMKDIRLFFIFLLFAFFTKEDVALCGIGIGLYTWWAKKQRNLGLAVVVFSMIYFLVVVKILMPMIGHSYDYNYLHRYKDLIPAGKGYEYILANIFMHPINAFKYVFGNAGKLYYIFMLLLPVGFIPLVNRFSSLVILLPSLAINLLSSYELQYQVFQSQYSSMIAVFVYFLTISGVQNIINFFTLADDADVRGVKEKINVKAVLVASIFMILIIISAYGLQYSVSAKYAAAIVSSIYFLMFLVAYNIVALVSFFTNTVSKSVAQKREEITKIIITTLIASALFFAMFQGLFVAVNSDFSIKMIMRHGVDREHIMRRIITLIPANASVSAHKNLVPHLSSREAVFDFMGADVSVYNGPNVRDAEYIAFDTKLEYRDVKAYRDMVHANDFPKLGERTQRAVPLMLQIEQISSILRQKKYGVMEYDHRYLLMKKGYNAQCNLMVANDVDKYLSKIKEAIKKEEMVAKKDAKI